jgi:hypothetical protein
MSMTRITGGKTALWLVIAAGLMLVAGANAHLVYVAQRSQPDCVAHERSGDAVRTTFRAAVSSCAVRRDGGQP